jgi:hypothetical protein
VGNQQSAISNQQSAISNQQSAVRCGRSLEMRRQGGWNRLFVAVAALGLIVCAVPLFASAHPDLNPSAQKDDVKLTDEDRAEIVSQMLKREIARIKEERAKYEGRRKRNLTLTLSIQNIRRSLVPNIPGAEFFFIEPVEIEKKIKEGLGISYLAFDKFEVKGPVVTASLSNVYRGAGRIRPFIYIKQNVYEYRKEDGKWVGKLVNSGGLIT